MSPDESVTGALHALHRGESGSEERLWNLVYADLRRLASRRLRGLSVDAPLNTTALVHELYLKVQRQDRISYLNRGHFFAVAARLVRHIIIDWVRASRAQRRDSGHPVLSLDDVDSAHSNGKALPPMDLLLLGEAIERLAQVQDVYARVVELRFFAGQTLLEVARTLQISPRKADSIWAFARSWLHRELAPTFGTWPNASND